LRALKAWLVWRAEPGEAKPRKVPYWVNGSRRYGEQGNPTDLARLATFDEAVACLRRGSYSGLGLAMLPQWGVVALDFDGCVDGQGVIDEQVLGLVADSYAEFSPSGRGIRAFFEGSLPDRKSLQSGAQFGFEVFHAKGFVTVTGHVLPECELVSGASIVPVTDRVRAFADHLFCGTHKDTIYGGEAGEAGEADPFEGLPLPGIDLAEAREMLWLLDPDMGRSDWLSIAMGMHHQGQGDEEWFRAFDDWSSAGLKYPDTKTLRAMWRGFKPGAMTIKYLIKMAGDARAARRAAGGRHGHAGRDARPASGALWGG
jgi:hypothetical protein